MPHTSSRCFDLYASQTITFPCKRSDQLWEFTLPTWLTSKCLINPEIRYFSVSVAVSNHHVSLQLGLYTAAAACCSNRYLNRSKLASTRLCNNHIIIMQRAGAVVNSHCRLAYWALRQEGAFISKMSMSKLARVIQNLC